MQSNSDGISQYPCHVNNQTWRARIGHGHLNFQYIIYPSLLQYPYYKFVADRLETTINIVYKTHSMLGQVTKLGAVSHY